MKPYRGRKSLLERNLNEGKGINRWFDWVEMPYGAARRQLIMQHLENIKDSDHPYMVINKKYCIILKRDPDLQRLLKQGKVKMIKVRAGLKMTYSAIIFNDN